MDNGRVKGAEAAGPGLPLQRFELGASLLDGSATYFRVWAPKVKNLSVRFPDRPENMVALLREEGDGYFAGIVPGIGEGDRYVYLFDDGTERPDPASRFQPDGVHGPSQVVDPAGFTWTDDGWKGIPLDACIIYEFHVGAFTGEGTFEAAISRLDYLVELGVTAVELMPVAQFPGERNWGYDGVYPFAPHNSYGGPAGLKRLIDACHRRGLAVILDVVYNHLGPEGNYLGCFGHYFTDRYRAPWGDAVNFDGPYSDEVRRFFLSSALYWIREFHLDALRIDAIQGIFDFSARHILQQLAEAVHGEVETLGRTVSIIAESSLNDVRSISSPELGGHGLDAQWNDDFHHALRTVLTGEREGYYMDFGEFSQLVTAFREGFVFSGQYSRYRRRSHGSSSSLFPPGRFVVFSQNHDQVGNRMRGDRLCRVLPFEKLKLAAGAVLLSPYIPLIFMGEEYGEDAPFPYFTSHGDPELAEAVRRGRKQEFASFAWQGEVPDPQAEGTFLAAKIDPEMRHGGVHRILFSLYRELIRLRKELNPLRKLSREEMEVVGIEPEKTLVMRRWSGGDEILCFFNVDDRQHSVSASVCHGSCRKVLDSANEQWGGPGGPAPVELPAGTGDGRVTLAPWSFVLYATG